jgi:PKD repeat protein
MRKIFLVVVLVILAVGFFYFLSNFSSPETAQAGSGHNVSGWAWSENIGWISFNSTNQNAVINYGINVDSAGNLSGYAWSEHIGWISFNASEVNGCPSAPSCAPKLDRTTGQVSGWARACAGTVNGDCKSATRTDGWDGWIHLRYDSDSDGIVNTDTNSDYGVFANGCDWDGYAWGSDVVGWIHFKGANYGVVGTGDACANRPPSATDFQVKSDYCAPTPALFFSWQFNDLDNDNETGFDFKINDVNNVEDPNPEVDISLSGLNNSNRSINEQAVQIVETPQPNKITYGKTYYWWVRVFDSKGANSGWIARPSFTTDSHAYPTVDFSWSPLNPAAGEKVQFTDKSTVYGGSTKKEWKWTFEGGTPSQSSAQDPPEIKFNSEGEKTASLKVTDSDGFACTAQKTIRMGKTLPDWKEIPPF